MNRLEMTAQNETGLELLGRKSLQLNPLGGTYPVDVPNGARVLETVDNQLAVDFYGINHRLNGNLGLQFKKIPINATAVFFPDFYYEVRNGTQKPIYGKPRYIPFDELRTMQLF